MSYEMPKCKSTVLKRTINQDLIDEHLEESHKDIGLSAKGMQKKRRGAFPDGGLRHAICRIGS